MESLPILVIVGIYTVANLIVLFVQKSEIRKLKDVNNSMTNLMNIFKIDELKKYVDLKEENALMTAYKLIEDKTKLKALIDQTANHQLKGMEEVHKELVTFIGALLDSLPQKERDEFIERKFSKSKRLFLKIFKEVDANRDIEKYK